MEVFPQGLPLVVQFTLLSPYLSGGEPRSEITVLLPGIWRQEKGQT